MTPTKRINEQVMRIRNLAGDFLRWTLIFVLFFYLFGLVMGLYEAIGFQSLVRTQVGGDADTARKVLLAVHAGTTGPRSHAQASEEQTSPRPQLPYGELALKLDALQAVVNKLDNIENIDTRLEQSNNEVEVRKHFEQEINQLELKVRALRDVLRSNRVDLAIAEDLNALSLTVNRLGAFAFRQLPSQPDQPDIATSQSPTLGTETRETVAQATPEEGPGTALGEPFAPATQPADDDTPTDSTSTNVETGTPAASTRAHTHRGGHPESEKEKRVREAKNKFETAVDDLQRASVQVVGLIELAGSDQVLAAELKTLTNGISALRAIQKLPGAAELDYTGTVTDEIAKSKDQHALSPAELNTLYERELDGIRAAIDSITAVLGAEYKTLQQAREISEPVRRIVSAADRLQGFQVRMAPSTGSAPANNEPSNLLKLGTDFAESKTALATAVERLETTLDRLTPEISISYAVGQDDKRITKANTILRAYNALGRFEPILRPFGLPFGFSVQNLATMGTQTLNLMLVFVMGAIGSLLYITKHRLTLAIQGQTGAAKPARPLSWYFFRPIFGIVVAFAVFLLYKAGQIALSAGTSNAISADVNVPILSVVSLFAGLLSWQALDTIESKGTTWFRSQHRRELWATGLDSALKGARPPRTIAECANQIGRSQEQVDRWIRGIDKVPPEMQDRISTWIGRPVSELFSDIEIPAGVAEGPLMATGLRDALTDKTHKLDEESLAEILDVNPEKVRQWAKLELKVTPPMQTRLIEVFGLPHSTLFDRSNQDEKWWAVGLRSALEKSAVGSANKLASQIDINPARIHQWMELLVSVEDRETRQKIARVLDVAPSRLFALHKPLKRLRWGLGLRAAMQAAHKSASQLAAEVDAEVSQVHAWMELDQSLGLIPPATQACIAATLERKPDAIFVDKRPDTAFRWASRSLAACLQDQEMEEFADRLDVDAARLERWLAREEQVAPETQAQIAGLLGRDGHELFVAATAASDPAEAAGRR